MGALKSINLAVRFLLELSLLAAVGYWGVKVAPSWVGKAALGIGLPVLVAAAWGLFVAPRAAFALHGAAHLAVELILLALGALALFAAGRPGWAGVYAALVVINKILLVVWKQ